MLTVPLFYRTKEVKEKEATKGCAPTKSCCLPLGQQPVLDMAIEEWAAIEKMHHFQR